MPSQQVATQLQHHQTRRTAPPSPRRVATTFQRLLGDEIALSLKTRTLHALTSVPTLAGVNGVFADQSTRLDSVMAMVASRVAPSAPSETLADYISLAPPPAPSPPPHAGSHLDDWLLEGHVRLISELRNLIDLFAEWEEADHQAFISWLLHEHEAMSWGLSTLIARERLADRAMPAFA